MEGIRAEGARWGAVDFDKDQSGDMMHFDLGDKAVATTTDPNTEGLVFTKG